MKRIAAFVLGFSLIATLAVVYLARRDPEPDMAGLSLLFFGLFALLGCLGAFLLSASRAQSWPKLIIELIPADAGPSLVFLQTLRCRRR